MIDEEGRVVREGHPPSCLCDTCEDEHPGKRDFFGAIKTYRIERVYQDTGRHVLIEDGVTREEAVRHCSDPETSSRTATSEEARQHTASCGDWMDVWYENDE